MSSSNNFELVMPFWIDTDGYTDRDREMFVCGVEFQIIYTAIKEKRVFDQCIHNENVDRVRLMCSRLKVTCELTRHDDQWTWLKLWV